MFMPVLRAHYHILLLGNLVTMQVLIDFGCHISWVFGLPAALSIFFVPQVVSLPFHLHLNFTA